MGEVTKTMAEQLITAQELAEQWGVSVYTIHRLAHQKGGLRAYKIGRSTRFRPSEVAEYLAAQEIKPPEKQTPLPGMQRFTYRPGMKVVQIG